VKQPWPPKEEIGTQVEPSGLTQAPLPAPTLVGPLTDELERPAIAKRVKNAGRKEWDSIVKRRVLPGLSQDATDDVYNPYTPTKKASRPPATPLKGKGSLSSSELNATPGWRKRAPPKQKQVFLPAESVQLTDGLATPDSASPRKVSAMRLLAKNEASALAKHETVTGKRTERHEPTFLGRIDRTNAFARSEPIPPLKHQMQKNQGHDDQPSAVFEGKRIRAIGDANCEALHQELERAGAALINNNGAEVDFYIVRLAGYAPSYSCECFH